MAKASSPLLTVDDLLAMPDDGFIRELIAGRLRQRPWMPNYPSHALTETKIVTALGKWLDNQPSPRGELLSGGASFLLQRNPDTFLSLDIAFMSDDHFAATPEKADFMEGPPTLAVEVLSPRGKIGETRERFKTLLSSGVPLVWVANPFLRTVMVLRPDAAPVLFNDSQEITAEPHLPGFRAAVRRFYDF